MTGECIRRYARVAADRPRFRSSLKAISPSTARNAIRIKDNFIKSKRRLDLILYKEQYENLITKDWC